MRTALRTLLIPQAKSKIKAGEGTTNGMYKFFTSSPVQSRYFHEATYDRPALIFGTGGNASVHFCTEPFSTSTDCLVMYGSSGANLELIYQYLRTNIHILQAGFKGAGLQHISKDYILEIEIDFPDEEKQKSLTEQVRKIDHMLCNNQQQLVKLDNLAKARFIEMFGDPEINPYEWECLPLSTLVSLEPQNGLYKPQSDYVEDGSGVPILRIDAFYNGKVTDLQNLKRLICSDTERERYLLRENDIVINRVNSIEYLGKCAHIRGMLEDTVFESNMMRFHLKESIIDAGFAVHLLCTQYIYKQILSRAKKAVNQASINQGDVMSFQMLVPPLTLQKQFVMLVEQVDKSKLVVQQSIEKLETLKKSLMQQYFG